MKTHFKCGNDNAYGHSLDGTHMLQYLSPTNKFESCTSSPAFSSRVTCATSLGRLLRSDIHS
eukprot:10366209-Prorocentrum_lima.AAC.1